MKTINVSFWIAMTIAFILGIASGAMIIAGAITYQICEQSRTTAIREDGCGQALDLTGTEYVCEQRNTSPDNNCHLNLVGWGER